MFKMDHTRSMKDSSNNNNNKVLPELLVAILQVQLLSQRRKADFQELPPNISASCPPVWDVYSQEDLVAIPGKYNIKENL